MLSVPHTEASRIALQSRTDNARAHADMNYIQHPYETLATEVAPERVQPWLTRPHESMIQITPGASTVATFKIRL